MSDEIKLSYVPNKNIDARVHNPGLDKTWNFDTQVFETVDPQVSDPTKYHIELMDVQNLGLYVGDFPPIPPPYAVYPVIFSQRVGALPAWSDPELDTVLELPWNGFVEVSPTPVLVGSYTTPNAGDAYFSMRLYSTAWTNANTDQKQKALNDATRLIDTLAFMGTKTTPYHEWPRSGLANIESTIVPKDIEYAQYEIAIALLKGYDPERDARKIGVTSRGFGSVRTTYDPRLTPEWLLYGIPSMTAWVYLSPYLLKGTAGAIKLHRVS